MKTLLYICMFLGVLAPISASADSVLRIGSGVSVDESQVVEGNYYAATPLWDRMTMSGTVEGDMHAVGGTVTINGEVNEDLFVLGGVSQVHATVTDDVRIVAGEVTIGEYVGGDLFVLAGSLTVLSSAEIAGSVFFFGGDAVIDGSVGQSVVGYAERVRINGTVGKDIDMTVPTGLQLGSKAEVAGSIRYKSFVELARDPASVVGGEISRTSEAEASSKEVARTALTPLFVILFTALTFYLFFRRQLLALVEIIFTRPVRSVVVGTGVFVASPLIALMLMVTVLGAIIGLVTFMVSTTLLVLGIVLAGTVLGSYLWQLYSKELTVSLWSILGGTILAYGLVGIPLVGVALYILLTILVIGASTLRIYQKLQ